MNTFLHLHVWTVEYHGGENVTTGFTALDCYTYFDFPFLESDTFDSMCLDSHLRRSTSLGSSADFLCTMRHHPYNLKRKLYFEENSPLMTYILRVCEVQVAQI